MFLYYTQFKIWIKNEHSMLGIWLEKNKLTLRDDLDIPKPKQDEVLIKVLKAGICNTDLELIKNYYSFTGILGHEFVGMVVEGSKALEGKRVVADINLGCGICTYCLLGSGKHCPNREVLGIIKKNGSFAEYLTMPIANVFLVPDNVTTQEACFTEPLAAALEILEQVKIKPSYKVAVIGDGKLGQLITKVLCLQPCQLFLFGHHPRKYLAYRNLGVVVGNEHDVTENHFDVVIECSGNSSGLDLALKIIKPEGYIVLKSTFAAKPSIDLSTIVVNENKLIGSRCGPFEPALKMLMHQSLDVVPLIDKEFSLSQGIEAVEYASRKGVMKILLNCELR